MTILSDMSSELTQKYKAEKPDAGFVQCVVGDMDVWRLGFFKDKKKRSTTEKRFGIADVQPVHSDRLAGYAIGPSLVGRELSFQDSTGVFKVTFSDGSLMFCAKWFSGMGKNRVVESIFGTEHSTWVKFLAMSKKARLRQTKPKLGIYTLTSHNGTVVYQKFKNIPTNPIFHEALPKIQDTINYYFAHVPDFTKYNQPGRRTILLYGEPGTSKTSTLYKVAQAHKDSKCIVFSTDISAIYKHIVLCEKFSIPTICCLEDCEGALGFNNSGVKSFMSGILTGKNKAGTCILLTTNYPDAIEESIRERPERIDELYYIGPISGDLLIDCADFYFGKFSPGKFTLSQVLKKPMTGAEVKLLVDKTLMYCASRRLDITGSSIQVVLEGYKKDIKLLGDFSKANSKSGSYAKRSREERDQMGFAAAVGGNTKSINWELETEKDNEREEEPEPV